MSLLPADTPWHLQHGDCLEQLRHLPNNSVDSVVTDPPAGIEFMGKEWDKFTQQEPTTCGTQTDAWGDFGNPFARSATPRFQGQRNASLLPFQDFIAEVFTEVRRVLKPGGYALVWALPRTSHHTKMGLERAGLEIVDDLYHLFGSGFPKSLDISKAIDKRGGQDVSWFGPWFRQWRIEHGVTAKQVAALFPSKQQYAGQEARGELTGCVSNWESGYSLPTNEQFNLICTTFGLPFDSLEAAEREVLRARTLVQGGGNSLEMRVGERREVQADVTAATTEEARQWEGWGTALKPAVECWLLVRKPQEPQ